MFSLEEGEFETLIVAIVLILIFGYWGITELMKRINPLVGWGILAVIVILGALGLFLYFGGLDLLFEELEEQEEPPAVKPRSVKEIKTFSEERKTAHAPRPSPLEKKIKRVLREFEPIRTKKFNESVLEAQMAQTLRVIFGKDNIQHQETRKSGKIDIVVSDRYGIELKLISSRGQLKSIVSQIFWYSKDYEKVFVYIYDLRGRLTVADVKEFRNALKEMGVRNVEVILKS